MKKNEISPIIKNVNLFDIAIYDFSLGIGSQSIRQGEITAITLKGINVATGNGDKFIKWCHVKKIIKNRNNK